MASLIGSASVSLWRFTREELLLFPPGLIQLFKLAVEVRSRAQEPYFKFLVGATVESESGKIYLGCNVGRATGTQTSHAESNAIDSMVAAEGSVKIKRLVVAGAPMGVN